MRLFIGNLILIFSLPVLGVTLTTPQKLKSRCLKEKSFGSCYELAWLYQNTSVPGDQASAQQFLFYGCKLDLKKKCTKEEAHSNQKSYMKSKWKWEKEKDKVLAQMTSMQSLSEKKCWKGDEKECEKAATHFFYLAPILNPQKAVELYRKGCELGRETCCSTLDLIKKGIIKVFDVEI